MSNETSSLVLHPSSADARKRLDTYLAEKIDGWSRSRLARLIDDGDVLVNDHEKKPSYKLRDGDRVDVELTELPATEFTPENIPLEIIYEDEDLAVINKPAGMVVHPGAGITGGTLANAIAYHFAHRPHAHSDGSNRVGIVHRLDKDTSGLIVVAKDEQTAEELSRQFHDREVKKTYLALVHGTIDTEKGKIDTPIARDRNNRVRMAVSKSGRTALTLWRVKKRLGKFTLLDVEIKTGRTHQIRVHLASINHAVVGDETYNGGRDNTVADPEVKKALTGLGRFFLHAQTLGFIHPRTSERMFFSMEPPQELTAFLSVLEGQ